MGGSAHLKIIGFRIFISRFITAPLMHLTGKLQVRVSKAQYSHKVDEHLSSAFSRIFYNDKDDFLDNVIEYVAEGDPAEIPKGMNKISDSSYSAITTYRELLDHIENPEFLKFKCKE